MKTVLKIAELISTDIRSRANADIIRSAIDGIKGDIILDFAGVVFVSRSFTDELYNIMGEYKKVSLENMSNMVKSMLDAVTAGRTSKRVFKEGDSEIKEFEDMSSLSSFLATI